MAETPFDTRFVPELSTLFVRGCVDELRLDDFREALRTSSHDYTVDLIVDLSEVQFLPSMAIGVLVGARKRFEEAGLEIVARHGTIARRVLEICWLTVDDPTPLAVEPAP